jgi:hypothetical protein
MQESKASTGGTQNVLRKSDKATVLDEHCSRDPKHTRVRPERLHKSLSPSPLRLAVVIN